MFPKIANPAWPTEIIEIFNQDVSATPLGCGRCHNAEWTSETTKDKTYFVVSVCRAGIPIDNGDAKQYCTAFMKVAANSQVQSDRVTNLPGKPPTALNRP